VNARLEHPFANAVALQNSGNLDGARQLYSEILKQQPDHLPSLMNLASICFQMQEYQLSLNLYSVILKIDPNLSDALFNRGCTFQALDEPDLAEQDYRACLKLTPGETACLENLIAILLEREKSIAECIRLAKQRLRVSRDLEYLLILAHYEAEDGNQTKANQLYQEIIDINPANPVATCQLATQYLNQGRLQEGIDGIQLRWSTPGFLVNNPPRVVPLRKWKQEPLEGKKLFISSEQGVGDGVKFSSSIPELQQEAGGLVLECDSRMVEIYQRSFPEIQVIPAAKTVMTVPDIDWSELDYYCSFADLPGTYTNHASSTGMDQWLTADSELARKWADWLDGSCGLKIGISWRGGSGNIDGKKRSLTLLDFMQIFDGQNNTLVSLQYDPDLSEINEVNQSARNPIQLPPDLDIRNDLDSLYALIENLDLVITIDNCTAYFAASLGKPVWVLLPSAADWRWGEHQGTLRSQSSMRRFRNSKESSWCGLLGKVKTSLGTFKPDETNKRNHILYSPKSTPSNNIPATSYAKKLLLINDSMNWSHWGYSSSSLALYRNLLGRNYRVSSYPASAIQQIRAFPLALNQFNSPELLSKFAAGHLDLMEAIQSTDLVIINGEGISESAGAIGLLYLAYIAKHAFGKQVQLLNHSFLSREALMAPDQLTLFQDVYRAFDYVVSTDETSHNLCQQMEVPGTQGFCGLPLAIKDFFSDISRESRGNTIALGASDGSTSESLAEITHLISDRGLGENFKFEFLLGARANMSSKDIAMIQALNTNNPGSFSIRFSTSESEWLSQIASSRLLVSDRLHHSTAAACLKTPFFLNSCHNQPSHLSQLSVPEDGALLTSVKAWLQGSNEPGIPAEQIEELRLMAGNNFLAL
jgi:tetratricopeptide (TPR) repeat protein